MIRPVLLFFLLYLFPLFPVFSQLNVSGSLQSNLYVTESGAQDQLTDFYQYVRLRVVPENNSNLSFNTYFRLANLGTSIVPGVAPAQSQGVDYQWNERVYNLYFNIKTAQKKLHFRVGRQFLYEGALNGTYDGALASARLNPHLKAKFFVGVEAPYSRELDVLSWDDGNAIGALVSAKLPNANQLEVSYLQRSRNQNIVWQIGEVALHGKPGQSFHYLVEYDHNFQTEDLQGLRLRTNYYFGNWGFSAEYNRQKPRILEDSFFRIFEIEAYNQLRGGLSYRLNQVELGLQYLYTSYAEADNSNELIGSVSSRFGSIGLVYQTGYAGDNTGVFGDVRYPVLPWLTLQGHSSYYKYERFMVDISEDATALSAGVIVQPLPRLKVSAEVQESTNNRYDNDVRGLFRLNYAFRN